MKQALLSFLMLPFCYFNAQITVTSSDAPTVGLRALNINDLNMTLIGPGEEGANQSFDFTVITSSNNDSVFYLSTTETIYAIDFPNSNLTMLNLPDTNYTFLNSTSSMIEMDGLIFPIDFINVNATTKAINNNRVKQIEFPINFNDSFTDDGTYATNSIPFEFGLPAGTIDGVDTAWIDSVKANITINRNSIIDAWGTMTTPDGSFSVLRQKSTDITLVEPLIHAWTTFTLFGNTFTVPTGFIAPPFEVPGFSGADTVISYFYYTNATTAMPSLIGQIDMNTLGMVTSAKYTKVYNPAGIIETNNNIISEIYPNPSSGIININASNEIENVNLYSEEGKLVYNRAINSSSFSVDLSTYNAGIYFIEVFSKNGREVKRINKI
jgi:hypothetical protein